jgi:hypothetical protein
MECGIDKLKSEAIQYIAKTVGSKASQLGGTVGSFGGINVGLGMPGKISIGDNKTIQVTQKCHLKTSGIGAKIIAVLAAALSPGAGDEMCSRLERGSSASQSVAATLHSILCQEDVATWRTEQ